MRLDSCFSMGSEHAVNEDYALSRLSPLPTLIVADGCSSSAHTDVGSRLISWAAQECIYNAYVNSDLADPGSQLGECIIKRAQLAARSLGALPDVGNNSLLDATLMLAYVISNHLYVQVYGDGIVAIKDKSASLSVYEIEYSHNAPYYLSYLSDRVRAKVWEEISIKAQKTIRSDSGLSIVNKFKPVTFRYALSEISLLMIASDGLRSFKQHSDKSVLSTKEIVHQLVDFKNTNGAFLQRRVKRQLSLWQKENLNNEDDLGIACLLTDGYFNESR